MLNVFQGPSHNINMVMDNKDLLEGGRDEVNFTVKLIIISSVVDQDLSLLSPLFCLIENDSHSYD